MNRYYRSTKSNDDPSATIGDTEFIGVDMYSAVENIPDGFVQEAVNHDFTNKDASTRGGFVCLPELGANPFGTAWTSEVSAANNDWYGVAYGEGIFVAVGSSGTGNRVMTSPDGETWTARTSAADNDWKSVCYGNGKFVAVASNVATNTVMYSDDGISWTAVTYSPGSAGWNSIAYGDGRYVAVGNGAMMTSTNATSWTVTTNAAWPVWTGVTYGDGKFVMVASQNGNPGQGLVLTGYSTNGTSITLGSAPSLLAWQSVAFGNSTFVAVADTTGGTGNQVMTSTDAVTWTARTDAADNNWRSIAFGGGLFIAVSDSGTGDRVMASADGITWSTRLSAADNSWKSVTYGGGVFVAVSASGTGDRVMRYAGGSVWATGIYSDPDDAGSQWIMLLGSTTVGFYQFGETSRSVSLGGYTISELSTIVQCNNQVYVFRGADYQPLYWDGNWSNTFALVPLTTPAAGFETIPYSNQATFYQNRLWVKNGKDTVSASDVLDFTTYDQLANSFNLNTGSSDFVVTTFPYGENSLIVFKNKSILALQNVQGALDDVTTTEVTRQVGAVGINSVVSIGPDLAYLSDSNIHLLTQTATNNAVQHKILPLSSHIRKLMKRVNWDYAHKASMAFWDNKLYLALPLDNATSCNTVCVYNFITSAWFGEWSFSDSINLKILGWAVANYLGLQRLHAITEDGRIFVTDEGYYDISGSTVAEISTSLTTRAYEANNETHFQRRMFMDIATNRPNFSAYSYTEGANESSTVLSNQTYSRTDSWKFNDSTYTATNANDDYNRAYRKDYSTGPDSIQCGSGFEPEMTQELRLPLIVGRQGRLSWLKIENTQGFISIMSAGFEVRPGQKANLVTV